jgi:hypothetical protein
MRITEKYLRTLYGKPKLAYYGEQSPADTRAAHRMQLPGPSTVIPLSYEGKQDRLDGYGTCRNAEYSIYSCDHDVNCSLHFV